MIRHKKDLDRKIQKYIDGLFSDVGESQELFDLKEELTTNIKEKVMDFKKRDMTEDEALKEAIISIGDLSGLVNDMRERGRDAAKKSVYSSMTARISAAGVIAGVLLVLFGMFVSAMLYFMKAIPGIAVAGPSIFIICGVILLTYSILIRETKKKFGMNKIRSGLYALSAGLILFSLYAGLTARLATGEMYVAISSSMIFVIVGIGLWLGLLLTGNDRKKSQ
ncbi:hypothetical protein SAMN04488072_106201 [Lentibacillus halodurans]|uniref:Uncharacterized protein n=1 Tax=Lentibacillus halodurans TaxID=237679 RepID=A0A1I0Y1T6_9BACI|nr:permease prefix domain 1-containing protein [Lentibacillus halodurans]SFB07319.1 hypothetical protein SAMN04488072_106201 [Lentibacillus halodurans]